MKCPVTQYDVAAEPDDECSEFTSMTVCKSCPAYKADKAFMQYKQPSIFVYLYHRLVKILLPFLVGLMILGTQASPALAHDPTHDTVPMVKKAITGGKAGGILRLNHSGTFGTWTDGKHVAIIKNGNVVTYYLSRDAEKVAAKAALEKGASEVSLSKGAKMLSAVKKLAPSGADVLFMVPKVITEPKCYQNGMNVCIQTKCIVNGRNVCLYGVPQ